ncbi:MAG: HNH endonuclease signature motif containing protein [Bacteriovoracaceae bacterium]
MKFIIALIFSLSCLHSFAGRMLYPKGPDLSVTPGSLCESPDEYRYQERIPYCERKVDSYLKDLSFQNYKKLGYTMSGERSEYKVDHFIPLCFGGSNNLNNLWPQHATVSQITDPIEALGCDTLKNGKITQKEVVELIRKAKLDLTQAKDVFKYLQTLQ